MNPQTVQRSPYPSVAAVVVHFRGGAHVGRCVDSCLEAGADEVVIVDNEGVGHRLRREFPGARIRIIQMARNEGYGRAANVGMGRCRAEAVIVLNQDVVLARDAVPEMLACGHEAGAWVVGPRLVGPDGEVAAAKLRFPSPLDVPMPGGDGAGWRYVPWVPGAAMLFMPGHTDLRFDPRLFMYVEDEEVCWRVWSSGGRVARAERAGAAHHGGTATRDRWGRPAITMRTVANRARMVVWHRGWRAFPAFAAGTVTRSVARRRKLEP